ncbi:transcription factor 20 isoform X2 [Trachinotus anak]|uniref:transcription factor 20 isoform X2 n=2 Tax=Trachinotus anak TaxID=443729 RepID=UPI0039F20C81
MDRGVKTLIVMEQAAGSLDDLQPQDLSTSSLPSVIDLTRKGEECVLNAASLQMVKSPGWYPNSGTSNPGRACSDSGSPDITLRSGDHIQPDNAFSHTTVTLSYVSRSHVFSPQDSLSRHSPLCGIPPVSKFSLPPPCDSDKGLGGAGYSLNQHYLEQVEGPVDLLAQVGPENDGGVCPAQEPREVNGGVVSSDEDTDKQGGNKLECSVSWESSSRGLENGRGHGRTSSGECVESSPEILTPTTVEEEEGGGSEVLFLVSKKQDPVDSVGARDLCSLSREYISPLEDPVSPSATSLDDVEDVFILPQASSSPSGDNSYLETEEAAWDGSSTEGAIQPGSGSSRSTAGLDSRDENKQPVHRRKAPIEPLIDLTDDVCVSDVSEDKPKTVTPHMNGNAKAPQTSLTEKRLPLRSSRGTRLEAIVMNINSNKYKVSGCIRSSKKARASQSAASDSNAASPKRSEALTGGRRRSRAGTSFSVKPVKQKAGTPVKRDKSNNMNTDSSKGSTSDPEPLAPSEKSHGSTHPNSPQFTVHSPQTHPPKSKRKPPSQASPQAALHKNSKKEPELLAPPEPSEEIHVARVSPPPPPSKSPKKSRGKAKGKTTGSKTSPTAKTKAAHTPKRRRKKHKGGQSSSMFSPKEPEIKLKYVNYKEEKRELRSDSFSPFVRVERQQSSPSLCTVINYPEEVRAQHKKGQQQQQAHPGGFLSAVVPSTSCLQLGRVSTQSQHQRSLVCCLCGQSANAMDLGDLHGPYYPEGYQPSTKTPASISGLKVDEDDYSDSDSSSCSSRGRRRKCTSPPSLWAPRPGAQLKKKGLLESHRWTGDSSGSPAAKRARSDASCADVEDWYSPPVLPLEPCEYWLHEDCGIWSAGVFLVKGRVYGLEEAVKVAQETVCSACCDAGATLGCFFKGCPNKYHYRCALESDCVLIEENFSMKCKKHKNKTFKTPPGNRWDDR